jgi:hypothetical protein
MAAPIPFLSYYRSTRAYLATLSQVPFLLLFPKRFVYESTCVSRLIVNEEIHVDKEL